MFASSLLHLPRTVARRRATLLVFLALWCLMSLSGGVSTALCLDDGGDCSPSTAVPMGPCHGPKDVDITPGCGSCIDVAVPSDSSFVSGRPDDDLRGPLEVLMPASAVRPSAAQAETLLPADTSPSGATAHLPPLVLRV